MLEMCPVIGHKLVSPTGKRRCRVLDAVLLKDKKLSLNNLCMFGSE